MKTTLLLLIFSFASFGAVTKTYSIPDMVCGHCEKAITKELLKIRGLSKQKFKFDISKKEVVITFDDNKLLTPQELATIQYEAGYGLVQK
jgi:copper chaperone CopZ